MADIYVQSPDAGQGAGTPYTSGAFDVTIVSVYPKNGKDAQLVAFSRQAGHDATVAEKRKT